MAKTTTQTAARSRALTRDTFRQAIDKTLLQTRSATLAHLDDALGQIDSGRYGVCVECGDRISKERLVALPFAVRCRDCEARREQQLGRAQASQRSASPFSHVTD
jgi:RNA polymerase-binding transcription factor DksA